MKNLSAVIVAGIFVALVVAVIPYIVFWAINLAFGTNYAITSFGQWFGMLILVGISSGAKLKISSKS